MFDKDELFVPSTNNGNEGTNSKFSVIFGAHKQFYTFLLFSMEQFCDHEDLIEALLTGTAKPRKYPPYEELKESREACKASLETGELTLDVYMGTMGRLSAKIGKAKQASDYSEADFVRSLDLDPPAVTVNYGLW